MRRNNVIMQPSAMPFTNQQPEYVQDLSQIFAEQNARNQQANAVNAKLDQQQRRGSDLTQLDELIAIQDRYKARKNAEMETPMYKEDQAKGLAQALLGTKQVESMSYGGNPVKQSPDGRYWLENNQEVTDVANIQTNNKYDDIAGTLNATKQGNALGVDILSKLMQPNSKTMTPEQVYANSIAKEERANAEWDRRNSLKEDDTKANQVSKLLEDLGVKNYSPSDQAVISGAFHSAKGDKKATDKLISSLLAHTSSDWIPFRNDRWLWQDNFAKDAQ